LAIDHHHGLTERDPCPGAGGSRNLPKFYQYHGAESALLYIATDLSDTAWLSYLLDEFHCINRAEFSFRIVQIDEIGEDNATLAYTREYFQGLCIPNRSRRGQPSSNIHWLTSDLFVLPDTLTDDARFACSFDLFWNAFVFLSRLEEYSAEKNGGKIYSYCNRHPRREKASFRIPVVNHLFDHLEKLIRNHYPHLSFGEPQKPFVELSHDVDYLKKTVQLRLKRTISNCFQMTRDLRSPSRFFGNLLETLSFLLAPAEYWCFDFWEEVEKNFQQRSVFYVYVATGKKTWISWLLDPSYDLAADPRLQDKLRHLLQEGFEIGLHGSIRSANEEKQLSREKELLENFLGSQVIKVRQHWLRYEESLTPALHSRYFLFDSTLGWNDQMGFRSGCASRHRHFDHESHLPCRHIITPMIIMDSHIYDGVGQIHALSQQALALIRNIRQYKTTHVSINWHQRVCSPDYGWQTLFEQILDLL
jgi:hypothetical protein